MYLVIHRKGLDDGWHLSVAYIFDELPEAQRVLFLLSNNHKGWHYKIIEGKDITDMV